MKISNKIEISFKDTKQEIKFDLGKNTVFYGINGKGKTRVLKTVSYLSEFAREESEEKLRKIVDEMNLEVLKINGVDYKSLFSKNDSIKSKQRVEMRKFIQRYRPVFDELMYNLRKLMDYSSSYISEINFRQFRELERDYERINRFEDMDDFEYFIRKYRRILRNIEKSIDMPRMDAQDRYLDGEFIHEKLRLLHDLYEKLSYINRDLIYNSENKTSLKGERDEILIELKSIKALYISTENISNTENERGIDLLYKEIINTYQNIAYAMIQNNQTEELNKVLNEKINRIQNIIIKFNEIIKNYISINLNITKNGEIEFNKNDEVICFTKLSSGEQRLIYVFLKILLNEADVYLIDEPEISLSLDFQSKIVGHLCELTKEKTLFLATHAPFVYEDFIAFSDEHCSIEV